MAIFIIQMLNALSYGMLLFLLAAGLTLTFGLLRIVNLTHGTFYLLGGYLGLTVIQMTGSFTMALIAATVATGALGFVMNIALLERYAGNERAQVLLTFGCLFLLADLSLWIFGGTPQKLPTPGLFAGVVPINGRPFPIYRFAVIGAGVLAMVLLTVIHHWTKIGKWVTAAVHDRKMVQALGINVPVLTMGVFVMGAALAGLAGVIGGPVLGMYPGADFEYLSLALAIIIVGGVGSITGSFVAAIGIGVLETMGRIYFPELTLFAIFAPMALTLILRPYGLFGRAQ